MSENQKEPQYKLRWQESLRNKVMDSAKENNRSINSEIIARLEKSFEFNKHLESDLSTEELIIILSNRLNGIKIEPIN